MLKFFKYQIKRDAKTALIHFVLLFLNTFLLTNLNFSLDKANKISIFLSIAFTALFVFSAYRISYLTNSDFFTNKKYFIFSLGISKSKIILAKFLYIFLYIILIILTMGLATIPEFSIADFMNLMNMEAFLFFLSLLVLTTSSVIFSYSLAKVFTNSLNIAHIFLFAVYIIENSLLFNALLYDYKIFSVISLIIIIISAVLLFASCYLFEKKIDI